MNGERLFIVGTGVALWIATVFSFLGALSLHRLSGPAFADFLMVAFLLAATLLLGILLGRTKAPETARQAGEARIDSPYLR